jgi:hypothetical protein
VFNEIAEDAKNVLSDIGLAVDDDILFNMFNIVVLSYAYSAYDQPKMREFMAIKVSPFSWISTIFLLYPIGAAIYTATHTPAKPSMIVGIWPGKFRAPTYRCRNCERHVQNPSPQEKVACACCWRYRFFNRDISFEYCGLTNRPRRTRQIQARAQWVAEIGPVIFAKI